MKEKYVNQVLGIILILSMILLNFELSVSCIKMNMCDLINNSSWGFMNGIILMTGLMMLGKD